MGERGVGGRRAHDRQRTPFCNVDDGNERPGAVGVERADYADHIFVRGIGLGVRGTAFDREVLRIGGRVVTRLEPDRVLACAEPSVLDHVASGGCHGHRRLSEVAAQRKIGHDEESRRVLPPDDLGAERARELSRSVAEVRGAVGERGIVAAPVRVDGQVRDPGIVAARLDAAHPLPAGRRRQAGRQVDPMPALVFRDPDLAAAYDDVARGPTDRDRLDDAIRRRVDARHLAVPAGNPETAFGVCKAADARADRHRPPERVRPWLDTPDHVRRLIRCSVGRPHRSAAGGRVESNGVQWDEGDLSAGRWVDSSDSTDPDRAAAAGQGPEEPREAAELQAATPSLHARKRGVRVDPDRYSVSDEKDGWRNRERG